MNYSDVQANAPVTFEFTAELDVSGQIPAATVVLRRVHNSKATVYLALRAPAGLNQSRVPSQVVPHNYIVVSARKLQEFRFFFNCLFNVEHAFFQGRALALQVVHSDRVPVHVGSDAHSLSACSRH